MAGKTSGSKSKNILSSLVELLLFSEARIEFPIVEVEFEAHHTRGPGTKFPCDPRMYWDIPCSALAGVYHCQDRLVLNAACRAHVLYICALTLLQYFSKNDAVGLLQFSYLSTVKAGLIMRNKYPSVLVDSRLLVKLGLIFLVCKQGGDQSFVPFVAWQNYRVIKARRVLRRLLSPAFCSKQNASVVFRHHLGRNTGTREKGLLQHSQVVTHVLCWGLCSTIISALWFLAQPYNKNPIFADDFLQTSNLISS